MRIEDWHTEIEKASSQNKPEPIVAVTFRHKYPTASQPVVVECNDGKEWVVKGQQNGKMLYNDHVVARIGELLGAPITEVAKVMIPATMVRTCSEMKHMKPGLSHGSLFIEGCFESREIRQEYLHTENIFRLAALHVLYSWAHAGDKQWIYEKQAPNRVYSVDHGHFFPNGPNWTVASLETAAPPEVQAEFGVCNLKPEHYQESVEKLQSITVAQLADILSQPPQEWECNLEERANLGGFLWKRMPLTVGVFKGGGVNG